MKFRSWLNIVILALLALVIIFGWKDLVQAWNLMGKVNIRIFILIIPIQFISYYAVGQIMFSYLQSKGDLLGISRRKVARISLELNFMNHIVPVPGAAGFTYFSWILGKMGISTSRSTIAQVIRYVLTFMSFISVVIVSVIALTFDNKINRTVTGISLIFILITIATIAIIIFSISNHKRLIAASNWLSRMINLIVHKITRGKKRQVIKEQTIENFFNEMHEDYTEICRDKRILVKPFFWALLSNILDVGLVWIAFLALGFSVNPAMLFIAYGLSSIASFFAVTPGGAGVYEGIMIAFLASAGVPAEVAIAGTLLARATLLAGTLLFGYISYQLTSAKYGKIPRSKTSL